MPQNIKRILITGMPGTGKTTLIRKVASELTIPFCGFFTGEIRVRGERRGFDIETFSGKRAVMAHIDIDSPYKVSKYGVDPAAIERIAIPEMEAAIKEGHLLVLDEIGKMELISEKFKKLLLVIFNSNNTLIASIMYKENPFCDRLKSSPGTEVIIVTRNNRDDIFKNITKRVIQLCNNSTVM